MKRRYLKTVLLFSLLFIALLSSRVSAVILENYSINENIKGTLSDDGTLTLTGTGKMPDYYYKGNIPWYNESRIKKIIIENGITEICNWNFAFLPNLEEITIPKSVTRINGTGLINSLKIKKFIVDNENPKLWVDEYGALCTKETNDYIEIIKLPQASSVTNYTIPNNINIIGSAAFAQCKKLKTVNFHNKISQIGAEAFMESGITTVTIPNIKLDFIGPEVFLECTELETVEFNASISRIKAYTFADCTKLKTVSFKDGIETIDFRCFENCSSLENIKFPNNLKKIETKAFKGCTSLKQINYPNTIASIYEDAFVDCTNLKNAIPNSFVLNSDHYYREKNVLLTAIGEYNYDYALEVINCVNNEREKLGVAPITFDKDLSDSAMLRAAELSFYFEHTRPSGMDCFTVNSRAFAENIAIDYSPESVVASWMNSPGHRRNIINGEFKSIGVGCYTVSGRNYYVQLFATSNSINSNISDYSGTRVANTKIEFNKRCIEDIYWYFDRTSEKSIEIGETKDLSPKIKSDGYVLGPVKTGEYSIVVGDTSVLQYNDGKLTALKLGETTVTIDVAGFKKTETIKVTKTPDAISLDKTSITLFVNEKVKLNSSYIPYNANKYNYTYWKSFNTNVATVDSNGNVTGVKAGMTRIRANTPNGKEAFCDITVKDEMTFPDVRPEDWFYNNVKYVYKYNMMNGYTQGDVAGYFGPNDNITRGQVVTILYRHENYPTANGNISFSDVNNSRMYYYNPIKWAAQNGIVTGYKEGINKGKFLPDNPITREEFAIILKRYANYKGKNTSVTANLNNFGDYTSVSPWAENEIKWAVGTGIISGNKDTAIPTLKPQGNTTRAEAATMIMRLCENIIK